MIPIKQNLLALLMALAAAFNGASGAEYVHSLAQAKEALDKGAPDTAISLFMQAYRDGFPRESLYYYLAESYMAKSVLDTALALNFGTRAAIGNPLRIDVLRQRARIYTVLGLADYAAEAADSAEFESRSGRTAMIPAWQLSAGIGYTAEKQTPQSDFPWNGVTTADTTVSSPDGALGSELAWNIPLRKKRELAFGLKGRISRPFGASNAALRTDSLDISAGAFAGLTVKAFSAGIAGTVRETFLGETVYPLQINAGYTAIRSQALLGTILEYTYTASSAAENRSSNGLALVIAERVHAPKIGCMLLINGYATPATDYPQSPLPVIDLARSIDTLGPLVYIKSNIDTLGMLPNSSHIVNSLVTIAPSVSYRHTLTQSAGISLRPGWGMSWFPEKYRWYSLDPPEHDTGTGLFFAARNPADGGYYWVNRVKSGPAAQDPFLTFTDGPLNYREFAEQRIDNALSLVVTFDWKFQHCGTVTITCDIAKNWSSFQQFNSPVDIPEWTIRPGLQWKCTFGK